MSAGKSHRSHGRCLNAAAISAVVPAAVRCARGGSLGAHFLIGAAPGCRAICPAAAGAEAQGAWAR